MCNCTLKVVAGAGSLVFRTQVSAFLTIPPSVVARHAMTDVGSVYYDRWTYLRKKQRAMEIWSDWLGTKVASV